MPYESEEERYVRLETQALMAAAGTTGFEKSKHEFLARHYMQARSKLKS